MTFHYCESFNDAWATRDMTYVKVEYDSRSPATLLSSANVSFPSHRPAGESAGTVEEAPEEEHPCWKAASWLSSFAKPNNPGHRSTRQKLPDPFVATLALKNDPDTGTRAKKWMSSEETKIKPHRRIDVRRTSPTRVWSVVQTWRSMLK